MIHDEMKNYILSQEEYNQYARHIVLQKVGTHGQKRLKTAKILFIGAGGLACPCMIYLVTSGIGHIGIVDDDIISVSNLQRQILYNKNDINNLKTEIAKRKIHQINPLCKVKIYSYKLTYNNAASLIKDYDIIVDTTDNFSTRYIIDEVCYKLHKIHVYGAIQNFEGQISVFNYKGGPKYSDLYPKSLNLEDNNCNDLGVLGVLPGIIGILQATEAIKIIIGLGHILSGYMIVYNAQTMSFKKVKILANKSITSNHYTYNPVNNTNVISCSELENENKNHLIFIDVRQKMEFEQQNIINAINIPLKEITYKHNIHLLNNYFKDHKIIIYCSHNSRAIIASNILYRYNIKHFRLKNGLNEWITYQ